MKNTYYFIILSIMFFYSTSCKKGYITPAHASVNNFAIVNITFLDPLNVDALFINNLPINFGLNNQGKFGITPNIPYSLSPVNGQTFNLKFKNGPNLLLDTSITVSAKGIDRYIVYADPANNSVVHIYTLHTEQQAAPGKGMARIRLVNALPGLPGKGAVNVLFSRKQNISINNGKPIQLGSETSYIEVPAGIYQPLLTDEVGSPILNYTRSFYYNDYHIFQWPQISLGPGGIYTLLMAKGYDYPSYAVSDKYLVATQLIQDGGKLQEAMGSLKFIHVNPYLSGVSIKVDGIPIDNTPLEYNAEELPVNLSMGSHTIKVYNEAGNEIIDQEVTILNGQNKIAFIAQGTEGRPEISLFTTNGYAGPDNPTAAVFFNFSPDSPPVTFLTENNLGQDNLLTAVGSDTITMNVPYLRIPKLNAAPDSTIGTSHTDPVRVFKYYPSMPPPQKLAIAFNVKNNTVDPNEVIRSATISYPFFEYQSFARYGSYLTNIGISYNDGDTGYFLVMLTGLRYQASDGRGLKIRVIKYVD